MSKEPSPKHACPCCDYVTLAERRVYLICPICFWEDDGQDSDDAENISIIEGRIKLLKPRFIEFEQEIQRKITSVEVLKLSKADHPFYVWYQSTNNKFVSFPVSSSGTKTYFCQP